MHIKINKFAAQRYNEFMSLMAVSIEIRGKVQGVWYRVSAKKEADRLHLSGFVRNQPDGSVYLEACGSLTSIGEFISWCLKGPEHAIVTEILVKNIHVFTSPQFSIDSTKNAGF
jgi:acylphosphatase